MNRIPAILVLAALLAPPANSAPWAVPDASLRFDFTVASQPSEPAAGILVFVPDGGLLPTPSPKPTVLDDAGKTVEHETLWHHPSEGLGLVIAKPSTPGFSVYVGRQSRFTRNDRASFTPGPLFYVKLGNAGLDLATRLTGGFPPGRDSIMGPVRLIGQQENPFGPDDDFSGWFSAWLTIDKPGSYYFATISDEGSLVKIDGKTVAEWPGQHTRKAGARGQFGSALNLTAGAHEVNYFYFNNGGASEAQLAWRAPGATNPLPTLVPASAYRQSGSSRLTGMAGKDGGPVALPTASCESYFWFGEQPANLFRLAPLLAGQNPRDTVYEWNMDDGKTVRGTDVIWIVEGSAPRVVTLTARLGNRVSAASCTLKLNTTPPAASAENPFHRQQYRTALLNRCKAVPPKSRPAADWSPDLWQLLINVVEPFKGQALFDELFERSQADLEKALSPADRALLEDLFTQNLYYADKARAAAWLDKLEKSERNIDRRRNWILQKTEWALYQAGDTNLARQTAAALAAQAPGSEAGTLALVRLGDIEAFAGRFDAARALYAQAQAQTPRKPGDLAKSSGTGSAGLARSKSELEAERARYAPGRKGGSGLGRKADPWKAEAVRGGAYYETIRNLLRNGYRREAREELRHWELELPSEKLGGEYPVAEADYFMAIQDYARARLILATYRQAVDVSPFMPRAMGLELDCLQRLGRPREASALAAIVLKRFPGHPVAERAGQIRPSIGSGESPTNPTVEAP